jgi:DNA-3-methyladenine glycosylase I
MSNAQKHCAWTGDDPLMIAYHDMEWGEPQHDDRKLFEFMVLDAFQAGLNWKTVLYKREQFRKAFAGYDIAKIARFGAAETEALMQDTGIIRNRQKIQAAITNARLFLEVQREFGSFDKYIWQFTGHKTKHNNWIARDQIPATSPESDAMSADLRRRGFKFAGSTICYAFMQATGMVNDHETGCWRYKELRTKA